MTFIKNLSNQYISESFQRLLQISGSENVVLDGTGSAKTISVEGTFKADTISGSHIGDGSGLTGVVASASPAGPDTSIQFRDGGSTSGSSDLTFDKITGEVSALIFSGSGENLTNIFDLELMIQQQEPSYYKTFEYSGGNLATASFYESPATQSLIFDKRFDYYGTGELSASFITRYSDNLTLRKTFGYTSGDLTSTIVTEV